MSEQLLMDFMSCLEMRDPAKLREWFTDDAVLWIPPAQPVEGARRIQAMFRLIFRGYTDLHWKVTEIYRVGERRYIYASNSWGTIGKDTPYKNHVLTLIDFNAEGKIFYLSDYFKDTAIFSSEKPAAISPQLA